jgi:hypothetical protein
MVVTSNFIMTMRKLLNIIILTIIVSGCGELKKILTTTKSYGLTGEVEFFSEKTLKIQLEKDWNYLNDTINPYSLISYKFFNSKGLLDSTYYFDKDSLFLSKVVYSFKLDKQGIVSVQYDKNGHKTNETKLVSCKDSIAYFEDYKFNTKEILSKTWIKKEDFKAIWIKSESVKDKIYSEWVYERNENGNEILIKTKFGFDKNQDYRTLKIKYLEWDINGNWTKRIEYNENERETACMLKIRQIKYYE